MKSVPRLSSKVPESGRVAPRGVCRRWAALVGIPVALLAAGEAAGQNKGLFRAVEPTAAVGARASSTPLDSLTLRRRLVSINFGQLALPLKTAAVPAAPAGVLRLNLFNDASFTVLVEGTAPTFSGGYSLSGRLAGVEMGTVTLVVNDGRGRGNGADAGDDLPHPPGGGRSARRQPDRSRSPATPRRTDSPATVGGRRRPIRTRPRRTSGAALSASCSVYEMTEQGRRRQRSGAQGKAPGKPGDHPRRD